MCLFIYLFYIYIKIYIYIYIYKYDTTHDIQCSVLLLPLLKDAVNLRF